MALTTSEAFSRFCDAWRKGQVDGLDEACAPAIVVHMPPFPDMDLAGFKQNILVTRNPGPRLQLLGG